MTHPHLSVGSLRLQRWMEVPVKTSGFDSIDTPRARTLCSVLIRVIVALCHCSPSSCETESGQVRSYRVVSPGRNGAPLFPEEELYLGLVGGLRARHRVA